MAYTDVGEKQTKWDLEKSLNVSSSHEGRPFMDKIIWARADGTSREALVYTISIPST